jgi:PAS domain S-box-containing protein
MTGIVAPPGTTVSSEPVSIRRPPTLTAADSRDPGGPVLHALDAVGVGVWELEVDTGRMVASSQFDRILGYDDQLDWTEGRFLEHVHPEDRPGIEQRMREAMRSGEEWSVEGRFVRPDGSARWIWVRGTPDDTARDDEPARYVGRVIDMSEHHESDAALRASAEGYRTLFQSTDEGFALCEMLVDDDGRAVDYRFLEVNDAFGEMTGIRPDAVGRTARELVPGLEDRWIELYARVALGHETLRFEEGSEAMGRWFDVFSVPHGDRRFLILFKDVTERRRTEEALKRSEEHARLAISVARLGTWAFDPVHDRITLDDRMRVMIGRTADEPPGSLEDFLAHVHPDDRAAVHGAVQAALDPAGTGGYAIEYRVVWPDGSVHWLAVNGQTQFTDDAAGRRATSFVGTALDITERKESEATLLRNEARLRTALAVKDEFLGLVSHELRTPMTVVLGMSRILTRQGFDPARTAAIAADIAESAESLNRLVESMLLLARLDRDEASQHREPVLLHRTAARVVETFQQRAGGQRVRLEIHDHETLVEVQSQWLEQVIDNLVGNAVKYSDPDRPIEVLVDTAGPDVELRVIDGGPGLSDDDLARVFEPFYRAPSAELRAGGAGLGLAVCKRIIESLDGTVWARRPPGGGAEFGFALPRLEAPLD